MSLLFPAPDVKTVPVTGSDDLFPIHRIFCVGRNYVAHAAEMGIEVDREKPFYFTKSVSHVMATGGTLAYPLGTQNFHYEMELAVYLGASVDTGDVMSSVFGYGCALDMTRRDLQLSERAHQRPWDLGKDVEGSAVVAPVTRAADMGPIDAQRIHLSQNGAIRQDATLAELVWSVQEIITHLSGFYHLGAGDVILTGTPAGVGPVGPGDVLEGGIDGLEGIALTIA
jgi:fumarylpyruvate hydrolase